MPAEPGLRGGDGISLAAPWRASRLPHGNADVKKNRNCAGVPIPVSRSVRVSGAATLRRVNLNTSTSEIDVA